MMDWRWARKAYLGLHDDSYVISGIVLFAVGSTSTAIALAWAGVQYAWNTTRVLVPLILGLANLLAYYLYEAKFAENPVVSMVVNFKHKHTHRFYRFP